MHRPTLRLAALAALVTSAVIFGMIVAGALDLTTDIAGFSPQATATSQTAPSAALQERPSQSIPDPVAASAEAEIRSFADLAEAVLPAVGMVRSTTFQQVDARSDLFQLIPRRGGEPRERSLQGVGSAFLISPDGWLVTNYHVVDGASRVEVHFDDLILEAEVKGSDPSTDLAVLKVEGENLPYLALGDSDELRVGDWVMAVGSPLGFGSSVTVGVVSAKGRILGITGDQAFDDFIQTDAAINQGNSGGPLVNTKGQVVGVSTAMRVAAENIGFAVPSRLLSDVVPQLRGSGRVARGYLGVSIKDVDEDLAATIPGLEKSAGVVVTGIAAKPARDAGVKAGDVIVAVDGHEVADGGELIARVSRHKPGKEIALDIVRRGKRIRKVVTLGDREEELLTRRTRPAAVEEEPTSIGWLGVEVVPLDSDLRRELGLDQSIEGVVFETVAARSPLTEKGVRDLDVVREVNGQPVDSVRDFRDAVSEVEAGERLLLFINSPSRGVQDFIVVRKP